MADKDTKQSVPKAYAVPKAAAVPKAYAVPKAASQQELNVIMATVYSEQV